jgi:hypothetical protein
MFFIAVNVVGFICNAYLYYIDIKYYNGILNKVQNGEQIEDLMTSPTVSRKELIRDNESKSQHHQNLLDYKIDKSSRNTLKKSMANHVK